MHDADDDLLAISRDLRHLEPAAEKQIEAVRRLALLEYRLTLQHAPGLRMVQECIEVGIAHPLEQRERPDDGAVYFHDQAASSRLVLKTIMQRRIEEGTPAPEGASLASQGCSFMGECPCPAKPQE